MLLAMSQLYKCIRTRKGTRNKKRKIKEIDKTVAKIMQETIAKLYIEQQNDS